MTGALPQNVADGVEEAQRPNPRPTLYGYLTGRSEYSILAELMKSKKFSFLDHAGARNTLFAPNNGAFEQLARSLSSNPIDTGNITAVVEVIEKAVPDLAKGKGFTDLTGILNYHILGDPYTFQQLQLMGEITTLQGKNLTFEEANRLVIDLDESRPDTNAGPINIFCKNGWLHAINGILLPFDVREAIAKSTPTALPPPPSPPAASAIVSPTVTPSPGSSATSPTPPVPTATATAPVQPDPSQPATGTIISPSASANAEISTELSPESTNESDDNVCFPGSSNVHLSDGSVLPMHQLSAGMEVMHDESESSRIFLFTHRLSEIKSWFYRIETASGHAVTLTGRHYMHANGVLASADSVKIGDEVRTISGKSAVTAVSKVLATGLYAPHSMNGDLIVDGIVVSCYTRAIHPRVAHALLMPVRWFVKITGVKEPLGRLLYHGGRGVERLLPQGNRFIKM